MAIVSAWFDGAESPHREWPPMRLADAESFAAARREEAKRRGWAICIEVRPVPL